MALARFFSRRKQASAPEQSSLRDRIVLAISTYVRVRGLGDLMMRDTVLVVRKDFECFMMHSSQALDHPSQVIGVYRLQDADCFAEFKKVYSDPILRSAALGKMTLGHLADQIADQITQQFAVTLAQTEALDAKAAQGKKKQRMLPAPAAVDSE